MGVASDVANNRPLKRRILVDGEDIIPLYDVTHILKGIRNNLLKKNLVWERDNDIVEARWRDIVAAYKIDTQSDIRLLPKITEFHIIPEKIRKMKVSYAAQVLSYSIAAAINSMARHNETDITREFFMDSNSSGTAMIIKEFDQIFDSLNGQGRKHGPLKPLAGPVTRRSMHAQYWKLAVDKVKRMYFKSDARQCCFPPSLKNLMLTIRGFIDLRKKLFSLGVKRFSPRQFNQDCLENHFGQMRQHRIRENKICAIQFEESHRALLIKQITSKQSLAANCEDTFDETLIQLSQLLNSNTPQLNNELSFNSNSKIDIIILASGSCINKQLKNFVLKLISR